VAKHAKSRLKVFSILSPCGSEIKETLQTKFRVLFHFYIRGSTAKIVHTCMITLISISIKHMPITQRLKINFFIVRMSPKSVFCVKFLLFSSQRLKRDLDICLGLRMISLICCLRWAIAHNSSACVYDLYCTVRKPESLKLSYFSVPCMLGKNMF